MRPGGKTSSAATPGARGANWMPPGRLVFAPVAAGVPGTGKVGKAGGAGRGAPGPGGVAGAAAGSVGVVGVAVVADGLIGRGSVRPGGLVAAAAATAARRASAAAFSRAMVAASGTAAAGGAAGAWAAARWAFSAVAASARVRIRQYDFTGFLSVVGSVRAGFGNDFHGVRKVTSSVARRRRWSGQGPIWGPARLWALLAWPRCWWRARSLESL